MSKRKFTYLLLVVMTSNSYAGPKSIDCDEVTEVERKAADLVRVAAKNQECPSMEPLGDLCYQVSSRTKDPKSDDDEDYIYRTKIFAASCADPSVDSDEVVKKKIQKFWSKFKDKLTCDVNNFDVSNGNIIKYAVSHKFESFIEDVAEWGVDLNRIDPYDKRTVLDYVDYELKRLKGTSLESELKRYKETLRNAGAKYARELN